jgi:hypothetical protein
VRLSETNISCNYERHGHVLGRAASGSVYQLFMPPQQPKTHF